MLDPFDLNFDTVEAYGEIERHLLEADPVGAHLRFDQLIFPFIFVPLEKGKYSYNFFVLGSMGIHSGVIVVDFQIGFSLLALSDTE